MGIFRKTFEVRRVLYGISSIISSDPRNAPEILKAEIASIMNIVVVLVDTYVTSKEKEINKEVKEATQMKTLAIQGFEDEDEFRNIMSKLKEIRKTEGKLFDIPPEDDDEDNEDEGESDYEPGDELLFTAGDLELYDSPLEKVDAPIYFKNVMDHLHTHNKELYDMLVGTLSEEHNEQLKKNFIKNEELLKLEKDFE